MRILLSSPSMDIGGAERVVAMLATGLAQRGHEVIVAAPPGIRDGDLVDVPHVRVLIDDHERSPVGAAATTLQLARAIRRSAPDVVHTQNVKATALALPAALAGGRARPPVLSTFHGLKPDEFGRAAQILRRASHVVCVSEDLRGHLVTAGVPHERTSVILNAIEPAVELSAQRRAEIDAELGLDGDAPVLAIVGRLVPAKAHHRFLQAARRVADAVPDARLLIVGDGELRAEIEAERDALGLGEQVIMTGARPDARDLIVRADVVVFSSEWEGLSIAALEALSAGTPVVATDVPGMRELLATGAGAIVPRDGGEALGAELVALMGDAPRRAAMGAAGRELIAGEFELDTMVDAYERRYAQLLEERGR